MVFVPPVSQYFCLKTGSTETGFNIIAERKYTKWSKKISSSNEVLLASFAVESYMAWNNSF